MKHQAANSLVLAGSILLIVFQNMAAQDGNILQQLLETEQETVEAIALYPEAERNAILEAAMHPEILARLERMQNNTQQQFQELIMPLPEEDQKRMYNVTRYPDLVGAVTATTKKLSKKEVEELAAAYPEAVQKDLVWANRAYFSMLVEINELYRISEQGLAALLDRYSPKTRDAYSNLIQLPEVLQLLTESMNATVLLGDIYRQNPEVVQMKLDSLNVIVAEQKAQELNEWRQYLEDNPDAMAEYEQSASEFANEQGYAEAEYEEPRSDGYTEHIYIHHIWRPYYYWFGWPYWYTYSYWYPYPWWYHWGYYYGPEQVIVFVGLPSYTFLHWHFYHYRHLYYYPRFTHIVLRYADHHSHTYSSITRVVDRWKSEIQNEVPNHWFADDGKRVERIREFGDFKMAYQSTTHTQNEHVITERQFLEKNQDRYPTLKPVLKEKPVPTEAPDKKRQMYPPIDPDKPKEQPRQDQWPIQQPEREQPRYPVKTRVQEKPQTQPQQIEKARNHHENIWVKPKSQTPGVVIPKREPVQQKPTRNPKTKEKTIQQKPPLKEQPKRNP